jgi:hypothetical protein
MKNIITILSLLIILVSCQKEYTGEISKETPGTVVASGSFKAKINSVQWSADKGAGAVFTTAGNGLPGLINISGLSLDKKAINMMLVDAGVNKYFFSDDEFQTGIYIDSTLPNTEFFSTDYTSEDTAGYVEITSINTATKMISGTFSFKVGRESDNTEVNITEGTFNIPYIDGAFLPPTASTDTFHVKVNDSLFTPFSISGFASNNTIRLQGSDSVAIKNVSLSLPGDVAPGSYSMDSFGYYGMYMDGSSSYGSVSGTVEIIENNTTTKRIRGNFNFKAEDSTNPSISADLTEGYFSVKYQ